MTRTRRVNYAADSHQLGLCSSGGVFQSDFDLSFRSCLSEGLLTSDTVSNKVFKTFSMIGSEVVFLSESDLSFRVSLSKGLLT